MKKNLERINPKTLFKLIGLGKALMEKASTLQLPDQSDIYITTPEQNKTKYYIVVLKAAFTNEKDAKEFLEFDKKLDAAIGEL